MQNIRHILLIHLRICIESCWLKPTNSLLLNIFSKLFRKHPTKSLSYGTDPDNSTNYTEAECALKDTAGEQNGNS